MDSHKSDSQAGGAVTGVSLSSFLQMAGLEGMTCTLKITSGHRVGYLHIRDGELYGAETGDLRAKEAAYDIVAWGDTEIRIKNSRGRKINEINLPLMRILMESARIRDEKMEQEAGDPPQDAGDQAGDDVHTIILEEEGAVPESPFHGEEETVSGKNIKAVKDWTSSTPQKLLDDARILKDALLADHKRRKKRKLIWSLALGTLVMAMAVFFAFAYLNEKRAFDETASKAAQTLELEKKLELWQGFIDVHKTGSWVKKAELIRRDIRKRMEKRALDMVDNQIGTWPRDPGHLEKGAALYRRFLKRYPDTFLEQQVINKITAIEKAVDEIHFKRFQEAIKEAGNDGEIIRLIRHYLTAYPGSSHCSELERRLREIAENQYDAIREAGQDGALERSIRLSRKFLTQFEDALGDEKIQQMLQQVADQRDLAVLKQKALEWGMDYENAAQGYRDYLKAHPGTALSDAISDELIRLDLKRQGKKQWMKLKNRAEDETLAMKERISILENYLWNNPGGSYVEEAQAMAARLRRQEKAEKRSNIRKRGVAKEEEYLEETAREEESRLRREKRITAVVRQIEEGVAAASGRFRINGDGTVTDTTTGLMWCVIDSFVDLGVLLDYPAALDYVKNLKTAGYTDWRLPDVSELVPLYKSRPFFPDLDTTRFYWTANRFWKGFDEFANIVTSTKEEKWTKKYRKLTDGCVVRAVRP